MSYIMTVYHALTQYVDISGKRDVVVHLVGAELELDLLPLFKELLCLLPGHSFYFYVFAPDRQVSAQFSNGKRIVMKLDDSNEDSQDFIQFNIINQSYDDYIVAGWIQTEEHKIPNVVIGLNAGVSAVEYQHNKDWLWALKYITENSLPALFTEYFNHSIMMNQKNIRNIFGIDIQTKYVVNPFRSPIVGFMDVMRFA